MGKDTELATFPEAYSEFPVEIDKPGNEISRFSTVTEDNWHR